jgi:hypothetical protein
VELVLLVAFLSVAIVHLGLIGTDMGRLGFAMIAEKTTRKSGKGKTDMTKQQKLEHIVLVALGGVALMASIGIIINSVRGRVDLLMVLAGIAFLLLNAHTVVKHGISLYRGRE